MKKCTLVPYTYSEQRRQDEAEEVEEEEAEEERDFEARMNLYLEETRGANISLSESKEKEVENSQLVGCELLEFGWLGKLIDHDIKAMKEKEEEVKKSRLVEDELFNLEFEMEDRLSSIPIYSERKKLNIYSGE